MSPAAAPARGQPSALPVGVPGASLTPKFLVRVRYTKRMRVQHVYRMVVQLVPAAKGASPSIASGDSVIARPVIPGAHVQPPELELGPKASNNKITFSVTPLAAGRLSGSRLQIVHLGRVLEEVKTPMRGVRPGRVLMWAALTLLAVAYLFGILGPLPDLSTAAPAKPSDKTAAGPPAGENMAVDNPMGDAKLEVPPSSTRKAKPTVASVLSQSPSKFPDYLQEDELPEGVREYVARNKLTDYAQESYDYLYQMPNLNFYIVVALLVVTLLSLFANRPALLGSRRKGKPMMLPTLP
ncbi:hypothetical protein AYO44_07275 [Planctomycetaceae bacterium SCGC AG-212-F19]|nr:hypothetical protein AYO44_07275 [Planctomycetaceae bacterium SCGC AG-212-F19]